MRLGRNRMPVRTVVSVGKLLQLNLLLVAGLFLSATQAKAQDVDDNGPTVVYTLVTVNGSKLPAKVSHGDVAIQVRSGTFTINADGTCSSKVVFGSPSGDDVTRKVNATYTREGAKLNMQWEGAGKTAGTFEGDSFTMNNEGMIFAYKKQPATPVSQDSSASPPEMKPLERLLGTWKVEQITRVPEETRSTKRWGASTTKVSPPSRGCTPMTRTERPIAIGFSCRGVFTLSQPELGTSEARRLPLRTGQEGTLREWSHSGFLMRLRLSSH